MPRVHDEELYSKGIGCKARSLSFLQDKVRKSFVVVIISGKCQSECGNEHIMSTKNEIQKCENCDTGFCDYCEKLVKALQSKEKMNVENPVDNVDNSL